MSLFKPIGGYFELELPDHGTMYHDDAYALNSGRNALEFIFRQHAYSKVYLPYYMCDVVLQPIKRYGLNYEFYHIDKNLTPCVNHVDNEEVLIYPNYFGIGTAKVNSVVAKYKNVIVDNSQAFFEKPLKRVPAFYSPRKFFGVPDGGFAYVCKSQVDYNLEHDFSEDRISHLVRRIERSPAEGYKLFRLNDAALNNLPVKKMSKLTRKLLYGINYEVARNKRKQNFQYLHKHLHRDNLLNWLIDECGYDTPMVYPFLNSNNGLREKLIDNKIFVATYWPNVFDWTNKNSQEYYLAKNLLALPIDQRYGEKEMERIIQIIES